MFIFSKSTIQRNIFNLHQRHFKAFLWTNATYLTLLEFVKKNARYFFLKKWLFLPAFLFILSLSGRFVLMNSIGLNSYVCFKESMSVCIYLSNTEILPHLINEQTYINMSHRCSWTDYNTILYKMKTLL